LSFGLILVATAAWPQARVASPDGRIVFELTPGVEQLQYRVTFGSRPVVGPSPLGFDLQNQPSLGANLKLTVAVASAGEDLRRCRGRRRPAHAYCDLAATRAAPHEVALEAGAGRRMRDSHSTGIA
jgi:hypothetical protein